MAKCEYCGCEFDLDEAAEEFEEWANDNGYDLEIDDVAYGDICADCAISMAGEGMAAGARDMEYFTD